MKLHTKGIAVTAVLLAGVLTTSTGAGDIGTPCQADLTDDRIVDIQDLIAVILDWGCESKCEADVNESGNVDVLDLVEVVLGWGACAD